MVRRMVKLSGMRPIKEWLRPEWSDRNLRLVLGSRLFMSSSRAMAGIVVPIYLVLLHYSGVRIGELFVVVAAASAVFSTLVGFVSDRIGRKPFLVIFPFFASLAALYFAISTNDVGLFLFAALGSFGRGAGAGAGLVGPYQPAENSLITENVVARFRNDVFGRLGLMATLGALLGSLASAIVPTSRLGGADPLSEFRPAMVVISIFALVATLLGTMIKETRTPAQQRAQRSSGFWPRKSMKLLTRFWITNSLNGLATGMFGPFISYWFFRRFGAGPAKIGMLYAVINAATLVSAVSAAPLARRFGLVRATSILRLLQSVLLIPFALAPTFLTAGAIYMVRMLSQRAALPLRQSYAVAMADPLERGRVAALSNVPSQFLSAASPSLAGWMFDNLALSVPFEIGGLVQFISVIFYYQFFKDLKPEEERDDGIELLGLPPDSPDETIAPPL